MAAKKPERRKAGRPPAAINPETRKPEKSRDLGKLTITMRKATRAKLDALAAVENRSAWIVVEAAINVYTSQLPTEDRKLVDALIHRAENR